MTWLFAYVVFALVSAWLSGRFGPDPDKFIDLGYRPARAGLSLDDKTSTFYTTLFLLPLVLLFWIFIILIKLIVMVWPSSFNPLTLVHNIVKRIVQWP